MVPERRRGRTCNTGDLGRADVVKDSREAALVARAADGDEDAVSVLYDVYAGPLYGFGLRRLGDPVLAEELVQSVLTRLWRHGGTYDPSRGSVRTWVFTIARTTAIDLYRRRPVAVPSGDLPDTVDPLDELDRLVRAEAVRIALDRLSPEHREVLDLAYCSASAIAGRNATRYAQVQ